ncbi:MAG TPA: divalent-cation tolerance protein CutA [Acidobacteriaceae bacterium]|nr:divalent-cation tolerance protein CutA [Acidobacteriaceae bacterium]
MIVPATEVRIVITSAGSREEADDIARNLVDERLAACVSVVPGVSSIYRWKGEVEAASENLLIIKTTAARLDGVEAALRRLHSYEVPEFLVLTPDGAGKSYLDWLLFEAGNHS